MTSPAAPPAAARIAPLAGAPSPGALLAEPPTADPSMVDAHHPLVARVALRRHLYCPDGSAMLSGTGVPASPAGLGLALGLGLLGMVAFLSAVVVAAGGVSDLAEVAPPLIAGGLLAGLLTFPPLVLVSALRQRLASPLHLAAAAAVGPAVAGAWLAASSPVVLLHAVGSEVDLGFVLLVQGLAALSVLAGAVAAVRSARAAGPWSPGPVAALGHYALTVWTALVLAVHLG